MFATRPAAPEAMAGNGMISCVPPRQRFRSSKRAAMWAKIDAGTLPRIEPIKTPMAERSFSTRSVSAPGTPPLAKRSIPCGSTLLAFEGFQRGAQRRLSAPV